MIEGTTLSSNDAESNAQKSPSLPVVVVDFQYFTDGSSKIIKELAVVELIDKDSPQTRLWTTVLPPSRNNCDFDQHRFVSESNHGLSWEEGIMNVDDAFRLLRVAIHGEEFKGGEKEEAVVVVKGFEKAIFLAEVVSHIHLIEYEALVTKRERMQSPSNTVPCPIHSRMSETFTCALKNCFKIATHLAQLSLTFEEVSLEEYLKDFITD